MARAAKRVIVPKDGRGGKRPTRYATKRQVSKAVLGMTAEQVHCRTLGHVWAHRSVHRVLGGYEQTLGCLNCESEKVQMISRTGVVQESKMHYAPGYLLTGLGRLRQDTKAIVRVASLEFIVSEDAGVVGVA